MSAAPHFLSVTCKDEADTQRFAHWLADTLKAGDRVLLSGALGAGKSVIARAVIRRLCGVADMEVPSPTFTLIQSYETPDGVPIWHSDLYRIDDPEEVYELGFDEVQDSGITLIEWPERLPASEQALGLFVRIDTCGGGPGARRITVSGGDGWAVRLRPRAILLAAGRGTRMGALAETCPKPLVPVGGRPLIDYALEHIGRSHMVHAATVNVHHLADQMEAHLAPHIRTGMVQISDERAELMETGGGVKKALPVLADAPFLVVNTDVILCQPPEVQPWFDRLLSQFDPARMDCLLTLFPTDRGIGFEGHGDLLPVGADQPGTDQAAPVALTSGSGPAPYLYVGTMATHKAAYRDCPSGPFSNLEIFRRAAAARRLYGLVFDGQALHVGSPQGVAAAEQFFAGERQR